MENLKKPEVSSYDKEEKVIPERDKMGLVQALTILHHFRDLQKCMGLQSELADALDVIFEWVDNAVLLFHKLAHLDPPDSSK